MYATVSLFGGILFYKGIDFLVHLLEGDVGDHNVDIDLYDLDGSSSANSPRRKTSAAALVAGGEKKSSAVEKDGSTFVEAGTIAVAPSGGADVVFPAADRPLPRKGGTSDGGGGDHRAHSTRDFPHEHDVAVSYTHLTLPTILRV